MNRSLYVTPHHNLCELHTQASPLVVFCSLTVDIDVVVVVVVQAAAPPSPHQEKTTAISAS